MANPKEPFSVLLIDLNGLDASLLSQKFSKEVSVPSHLDVSKSIPDALRKIEARPYHLILADCHSPDELQDIEDVLRKIHDKKITTPVVVMISPGEEARARKMVKVGATDFVVKGEKEFGELPQKLWGIFRTYELTREKTDLEGEISEGHGRLSEINDKLRKLTIRDELTGLYNHRYFQERLNEEFERALRYGHPLSCLLVDIDFFRRVNENLGHAVGDEILKEVSGILVESCRTSDFLGRFGGEEFSILLPHVDYPGASELAKRIREIFSEHTFLPQSHRMAVTVSLGVASFPEDAVKHRSDLLNFADQALFCAKAAGRNRVCLYRDVMPTVGENLPRLKISEEKIIEFQKRLTDIVDKARRGYVESSKAMMAALESKDHYTADHAGNVARISLQVAEAMGLSLDEAEIVEHAALLHDIGKICISDPVLLKPARFSHGEYEAMKQHPYFGYRIVKPIKYLQQEAILILHHHEWYNGEGYPCRLAKNEIPLGARIISVIDSYDTMRLAGGRYKKTMSLEEAVNELIRCAGKQFDPEVVRAFVQVMLLRKELDLRAYNKKDLESALTGAHPR